MEASRVALPKVGLSAPLRLRRGGAEAERRRSGDGRG